MAMFGFDAACRRLCHRSTNGRKASCSFSWMMRYAVQGT
jgi:hypothetical protein